MSTQMVGADGMARSQQVRRTSTSSGLYELVDLILEKGLVIDACVRVSLVGLEVLLVEARVVVASVDTYLRYAAGIENLSLTRHTGTPRPPELVAARPQRNLAKGVPSVARELLSSEEDTEGGETDRGQEKEDGAKELVKVGRSSADRRNGSGKPARTGARR